MKPCTCSDYQHVGCRGEAGLGEGWYCIDKHPNGPPPNPTPPADPRTVLRSLVEEIDGFAEHRDSSAQTCLGFALEDARPALTAIAGKVWLDVDVVRGLIGMANVACEEDCDVVNVAAAELRAVEEGR